MNCLRVTLIRNAAERREGFTPRSIEGTIRAGITARALVQAGRWRLRLQEHHEEDALWDWGAFVSEYPISGSAKTARFGHYSLWVARELQALMILEESGRRHRTREALLPQIYVEYLSVAPHSRPKIQQPRKVTGCGLAMLKWAITLSARKGWQGRVGLHSLPGALTFYRKQGFRDLGADPAEEGFHYMEFEGML
jgi:hypothetical protein